MVGFILGAAAVLEGAGSDAGFEVGLQLQAGGGLVVVRFVLGAAAVAVRADLGTGLQVRLEFHFKFLFLSGSMAVLGYI